MKLLIIESNLPAAQNMISYLSGENYICEYANTYERALTKIETYEYDCILMDHHLPDGVGDVLLATIKDRNKQSGVIIVSANDAYEDKVQALMQGADDYLCKPFHLSELSARVFSVIRRRRYNNSNIIRQRELAIDLLHKTVTIHDKPVILTRKELELLLFFLGNKNKVLAKNELAEQISGDIAGMRDDYNFIYTHIKNLKKKLQEAGAGNYLKTVYSSGYKWECTD